MIRVLDVRSGSAPHVHRVGFNPKRAWRANTSSWCIADKRTSGSNESLHKKTLLLEGRRRWEKRKILRNHEAYENVGDGTVEWSSRLTNEANDMRKKSKSVDSSLRFWDNLHNNLRSFGCFFAVEKNWKRERAKKKLEKRRFTSSSENFFFFKPHGTRCNRFLVPSCTIQRIHQVHFASVLLKPVSKHLFNFSFKNIRLRLARVCLPGKNTHRRRLRNRFLWN